MGCNRFYSRRCFFKLAGIGLTSLVLPVKMTGLDKNGNYETTSMKLTDPSGGATTNYRPPYLDLHHKGILKERASILHDMMSRCTLCPRNCEANRIRGRRGDCNANANLEISSVAPHFGEERELVGRHGSGTIFFTNCSLLCVFCINYDISQYGRGQRQSIDYLANAMLRLQQMGCHNINLVTPSHYVPHIVSAIDVAAGKGLRLPIVYNTCGWEKMEMLRLLDGIVDIYLADFKYFSSEASNKYSPGADCYPDTAKSAIIEMHRQVGLARPDNETSLMNRGLMIRHLVMPNNVAHSDKVMQWIGEHLPSNTYVNLMSQYTPVHKAHKFPEINRRITQNEYRMAIQAAKNAGLTNLILQGG